MNDSLPRLKHILSRALIAVALWNVVVALALAAPAFDREVMSVLAKAGCNMGTCHGNLNGKGGFKLSLRGFEPQRDFVTLTHGHGGRRINRTQPEDSLLLQKATMAVPHEGGKRFDADSPEYKILVDWIRTGATRAKNVARVLRLEVEPRDIVLMDPQSETQIRAVAEFADGRKVDVSHLALYEPSEPVVDISKTGLISRRDFAQTVVIVRYLDQQVPVRVAFTPTRPAVSQSKDQPTHVIDRHIFDRLAKLRIEPASRCDDLTFLRRACLDLTGLLPRADVARAFIADSQPEKRSRLVDELLDGPEFAECWSQKWADLLRVEEKTLDRKGVEAFHSWLRNSVATNQPLDAFVRQLITSRGSTYSQPASNYYRAMRTVEMRAESTAQLFLGIRLQCAKCHNHPFDQWTQDDYYGWSNLFARVDYQILENRRRDKNDQHEFDGEQVVWMKSSGDIEHPDGRLIAPRVLSKDAPSVNQKKDRLESLAAWLTSPQNARFAEVHTNRIWSHLMGRGLVHPIDDFRATNPASHPELLAELGRELASHKFDARSLIRTIMLSETYQLSAAARDELTADGLFAAAQPRRLTAEQLVDAASQVLNVSVPFNGYPIGHRAGQIPGVHVFRMRDQRLSPGDRFLTVFGKPPRLQACDCERRADSTLAQAFELVSGPLLNDLLQQPANQIGRMQVAARTTDEVVVDLYWRALSRAPLESELALSRRLVETSPQPRGALEDLAWSLLNSNEFLFRR